MGGCFSSPPAMEANRVGATRLSVVSKWKPSEWGRSYLTVKDADGNVLFEVKGSGICNLGYVMSDEDGDKVLDAVISFAGGQVVHIDGGKHTGYTGTTNTNFMLGMSVLQMSLKSGETFTGVVYKRIGKCRMDLYPGIMSTAPLDGKGLVAQLFTVGTFSQQGTMVVTKDCMYEIPCAMLVVMMASNLL